jgi:chromosome segregation ATPase
MGLEQFVHHVESNLLKLGTLLAPTDPRAKLEDEADDLVTELQKHHADLCKAEQECAEVRRRLEENEARAALLPSQIEAGVRRGRGEDAYTCAMELERAREALTRDRAELPRLEQRMWSLQFLIRQVERRLARVQNRLNAPTPKQ